MLKSWEERRKKQVRAKGKDSVAPTSPQGCPNAAQDAASSSGELSLFTYFFNIDENNYKHSKYNILINIHMSNNLFEKIRRAFTAKYHPIMVS